MTQDSYLNWINGQYVQPHTGEWIDTIDPATGKVWVRIARGSVEDADHAVHSAKTALTSGSWKSMTATQRGKILRKIGDLLVENVDELAKLEVSDNGKLISECVGQIKAAAENWYYFAGAADKIEGIAPQIEKSDVLAYTRRDPVGVVLALTAWNSPLYFVAIKCAPALAAGCTVVVKPSEFSTVSTIAFAELTKKAGLPDGVLNIVSGYGNEIGAALVEHPDVAKITFTGSDVTGSKVYEAAARQMKRVSLELGGKSPNIVFKDADLDSAAMGVASGVFGAAGQMCTAGSRVLVQNSIKDEFTDRLIAIGKSIKVGDPLDPDTQMGPISTKPQYEKVLHYINVAIEDGADCILGGTSSSKMSGTGGYYVEPTIFTDVTNSMRIAQEEVFGPILSIIGFNDEDEATAIANDTVYGLAAGIWTSDLGRMVRMSDALEVGTVWGNTYRTYSFMMPFGGRKHSGMGRENGLEAISEYLETKSIMINIASEPPSNSFVPR